MAGSARARGALVPVVLALCGLFGGSATAFAETVALKAMLDGAAEVPPNDSPGTGRATFTYDTDTKHLTYSITYDGLTGPATAGHIHGPAAAGESAGIVVPFAVPESPISGTATLTDDQAAALLAGRLYVNIHTAANKAGEIRGQIVK
jgi:hypothetical protein